MRECAGLEFAHESGQSELQRKMTAMKTDALSERLGHVVYETARRRRNERPEAKRPRNARKS